MKDLFINYINFAIYNGDATAMLLAAIDKGDKSISSASFAVARGADVNAKDAEGNPMFCKVIKLNSTQTAKLLIDQKGIDLNATSSNGSTVLHYIAKYADLLRSGIIEQFLAKEGVDINVKDINGNTPLHVAFMNIGNFDMAKLFLAIDGIDLNAKNNSGNTPLHEAANNTGNIYLRATQELLSKETADVNSINNAGQTALHLAALRGNVEVVKSLIAHGINTEAKDLSDHTALDFSIIANQVEVAKTLVETGVEMTPAQLFTLEELGVIAPLHKEEMLEVDTRLEEIKASVDVEITPSQQLAELEEIYAYGNQTSVDEYDSLMETVEDMTSPLVELEKLGINALNKEEAIEIKADEPYSNQAAFAGLKYDLSVLRGDIQMGAAKSSIETQGKISPSQPIEFADTYEDETSLDEYDSLMETVEAMTSPQSLELAVIALNEEEIPETAAGHDSYGDQAALDEYDLSVLRGETPHHHGDA